MIYTWQHQIQYYETDQMRIAHHSNYIRWFEEARTYALDQAGFGYGKMEECGVMSPVVSVSAEYKEMSRFPETLLIDTEVKRYNGIRLVISYVVKEKETGEKNYYIAVKKVDPNGTPIVGVTFDVAVNGDKTSLLHMVTNSNGIATLNLGKYFSKPYVAIRETDDWDGAEEFQIDTRWYGKKEARGDVGVYTSVAEARSHVTEVRHLRENKREPVYVCVRKRSANSEITENNPNYSLEDARYKVYKSEEDAKEALQTRDFSKADGTLKTDADGETGLMDVTSLMELNSKGRLRPSGTRVYLVESKAPKGYQMSNKVSNVIVYPNNTKDNPALIEVSDTPVTEVLHLGIRKVHL